MSDQQLAVLIIGAITTVCAGAAKLVMWGVTKWLDDRAAERLERKEDRAQDREATKAVATAMTTMALKFDNFEKKLVEVQSAAVAAQGAVQWAVDEVTGKHDVPVAPTTPPRRTPPGGYLQVRPKTEGG